MQLVVKSDRVPALVGRDTEPRPTSNELTFGPTFALKASQSSPLWVDSCPRAAVRRIARICLEIRGYLTASRRLASAGRLQLAGLLYRRPDEAPKFSRIAGPAAGSISFSAL